MIKVLDMDEYLGSSLVNPGRAGKDDDLEAVLRDATKMKVNRIKMMEIDKYLLQSEQELEKLKRGESLTSTDGPLTSSADFMKMARMMSDLTPEEQKRFASAYTVLRMADKGQVGGSLQLLGPLLGYARQNPGSSEADLIKYLTLMDSQFSKGLQLAQSITPKQDEDSTIKFLTLMKDIVVEGVRNPVLQAIEKAQPQPSAFEQIIMNPELFTRFTGLMGGGKGSTNIDLEIEKLRGERDLNNRKLDLQWRKDLLDIEAKDKQTDRILATLTPLATLLAGPVAQRMGKLGEQQAITHIPQNPTPPTALQASIPPTETTILIKCSCGYEGSETFTGPQPSTIKCPHCNQELVIGGTSPEKTT